MSLPSPEQLESLSALLIVEGKKTQNKWYTYQNVLSSLERNKGDLASMAVSGGVKSGVNAAGAAAGVATGVAFVPIAAALTPWIAAAEVVRQAGDIFELHDLKEEALKTGGRYKCVCGKCAINIGYVVDKKEMGVAKIAVGVATLGASAIFTTAHDISKSFESGRPKELHSKGLVDSARIGCTVAMAAIFLLAGNWAFMKGGNAGTMRRAVSILTSEDGWAELKKSY